jgi:hypothetical protein
MKRCKMCKHFKLEGKDFGACVSPKFEYGYESTRDNAVTYENDMLLYIDYECYSAGFQVGKNFGCIHHETLTKGI